MNLLIEYIDGYDVNFWKIRIKSISLAYGNGYNVKHIREIEIRDIFLMIELT